MARHKKLNKHSIAAKARWAKVKAANENKIVTGLKEAVKYSQGHGFKVGDTLRIRMPKDYIINETPTQTRLDKILDSFEQAVREVITKLKATF